MARLTPQYEVTPQSARRMARDAGATIREQRVFCRKVRKYHLLRQNPAARGPIKRLQARPNLLRGGHHIFQRPLCLLVVAGLQTAIWVNP